MPSSTLPSDASSLLVPVHLSAWSYNSSNQETLAWYQANYENLKDFLPIMDEPFTTGSATPPYGIHLQWSLPDALTHGREASDGSGVQFPLVPNRWLVARFSTQDSTYASKLWVVQSDYIPSNQPIGITAEALNSNHDNYTSISLAGSGATMAIAANTMLQLSDGDPNNMPTVTVSADVAIGDTSISINSQFFGVNLKAGATVFLPGNNYLNPSSDVTPAGMEVDPAKGQTQINVPSSGLGLHYTVDAWEVSGDPGGTPFLQAVAPGNVTFAAYAPQIQDVFAFVDTDVTTLPAGSPTAFTYLVVGWYSESASADPLLGLTTYVPGIWKSEAVWATQTVTQRFQTLLNAYAWSVDNPSVATPPSTTLFHGSVVDAQWPPADLLAPNIGNSNVQVIVGNTAIDALSQLVINIASQSTTDQPATKNAGAALAELLEAAQYELLDEYGQPGGAESIDQQVHNAWFGSQPGGTIWTTVSRGVSVAGGKPASSTLSEDQQTALNKYLGELNTAQASFDQMSRQLETTQANLFLTWWKTALADSNTTQPLKKSDWTKVVDYLNKTGYPDAINAAWQQTYNVQQAQAQLPSSTDAEAANTWANTNWSFTNAAGKSVTLADLGLRLKATTAPRYWNPNDPVVLISGLNRAQVSGEDGRYSADGKLLCRLPGETITGITVAGTAVTASSLPSTVGLDPTASYTQVPSISNLAVEAFFTDPANAGIIASLIPNGDSTTINADIQTLLNGQTPSDSTSWIGTAPVPFAITLWQQAWIPLFLEWSVNYYPTGSGSGAQRQFAMSDWSFDGTDFNWNGTGFSSDSVITYKERTFLTPSAAQTFKSKLTKYLKGKTANEPELQTLLDSIAGWDVLSQSLSGFSKLLVTQVQQETFLPPGTVPNPFVCPNPDDGGTAPNIASLVGDQYHAVPLVSGTAQPTNPFNPIRAGFIQFAQLQVVDAFGQVYAFDFEQGAEPSPAEGLAPTNPPAGFPDGLIQLPPRFVQGGRLNFDLLANDGSGTTIDSSNPNAICGWLLPNFLDGGISIYDQNGILLGELLGPPATVAWRPRPGIPGDNPPPASPSDIANPVLQAVVTTLANQISNFGDILQVMDATLWTTDPLGGRKDQLLTSFIGRPLAVVQAQLSVDLYGDPATNQMWDSVIDLQTGDPVNDTGEVASISIPVALGSLQIRNDGLIGYFLPGSQGSTTPYTKFYSVAAPVETDGTDTFIQQILTTSGGTSAYQGDVTVQYNGAPVVVTMIVDPRGTVHASSGMLPVATASLPASAMETFIQNLDVTFSVGPLLAPAGIMSLPKPAEDRGAWSWIKASSTPGSWLQTRITNASDQALLPDQPPVIQEGWLSLSHFTPKKPN